MLTVEQLDKIESRTQELIEPSPKEVLDLVKMARRYHQMIDAARAARYQFQIDGSGRISMRPMITGTAYADQVIAECSGGDGTDLFRRYTEGDDWNTKT